MFSLYEEAREYLQFSSKKFGVTGKNKGTEVLDHKLIPSKVTEFTFSTRPNGLPKLEKAFIRTLRNA